MWLALDFPRNLICRMPTINGDGPLDHLRVSEHLMARKRLFGGILHTKSLRTLKERRAACYPLSFIVYNAKPVGHQVLNMCGAYLLNLLTISSF